MPIDIEAGTVIMRAGLLLPAGVSLETTLYSRDWNVITGLDAFEMDRLLRAAGWSFFFMAGAVHAVTFGRREGKNARQAVDRILSRVRAQNFNCVEITEISTKHFLNSLHVSLRSSAPDPVRANASERNPARPGTAPRGLGAELALLSTPAFNWMCTQGQQRWNRGKQ